MKSCPRCGELLGENVQVCFKCRYSFEFNRILTSDEVHGSSRQVSPEEKRQAEIKAQEMISVQLEKNPRYEYKTVVIGDREDGGVDERSIQGTLDTYSKAGWRLHSVFSAEIGKSSRSVGIGGISTGLNSTIDQTVLIFERCIKA